jgi:hypothetical protein
MSQAMNKEQAIRNILKVLNSRMAMMSPAKKQALELAEEHNVTAKDLIEEFEKILFNT